jgi:hypothetical protein
MDVCKVEGCNNEGRPDSRTGKKFLRRGMCHKHYARWLRNGDPLVDGRWLRKLRKAIEEYNAPEVTEKQCSVCKKTKPIAEYYKRGDWTYTWCKACHKDKMDAQRLQQRLENPPKPKEPVDHGKCAFPDCNNKAKTRLTNGPEGWFCPGHWQQGYSGKEMTPLKVIRKSEIDDRFRRCTSCLKVKTHEQFHNRTHGKGKQAECKECLYKRVRFNLFLKQGRLDDAVEIYNTMPPIMQDKLENRLKEAQAA